MSELYQVGAITQTHGIHGEVKVFPLTDDVMRFRNEKHLILKTKQGQIPLEVTSARPQKNLVILKFLGYDDIGDVERFKGCGLYVDKEHRVPLHPDEYFIADLIGIDVYENEKRIGKVSDVLATGANDVYVIESDLYGEILLPAIKDCILSVDVDARVMHIHLLPGLIDDVKESS